MKNKDYIMDFRQALKRAEQPIWDIELPKGTEDKFSKLICLFESNKHITYDEEHYPRVYFEDLKVGHRIYVKETVDGSCSGIPYWVEAEITHIYNKFVFYNIINPPTNDKRWLEEKWASKGSVSFLRGMYPKKIIICGDWKVECDCPLTQIEIDENMDNKYSSVFENKPERRY